MDAQLKNYRFTIDGMTCASCASRIERVLAKDANNKQVAVNFPSRSASLATSHSAVEIKEAIESLGYGAALRPDQKALAAREAAQMLAARRDVLLAGILSLPVVLLGMFIPDFPGSGLLQLGLTSLVLAGPGRGFYLRSFAQIRHGQMSMDTLVALGTASAYFFSIYLMALGHPHLYFESAAVIVALILVGKYLEERARQSIADAVRELLKFQPSEAILLAAPGEPGERERRVAVEALLHGSLILAKPGDRLPVDGIVRRGGSAIDASMLTGESLPVEVQAGSTVAAGTVNLTGPLVIETTGTGAETELAKIVEMVEAAQGTKAPIQKVADQVAGWFVPAAVGIAVATLMAWLALGHGLEAALTAAVAVLVVACPCALGLATPVAIMAGTGQAARRGILVKDAAALQVLHKATAIVFDKTGTLTMGRPEVTGLELLGDIEEPILLGWAASLEAGSNHPLALAILRFAKERLPHQGAGIGLANVRETAGYGVSGELEGSPLGRVTIGKLDAFSQLKGSDAAQALAMTHADLGLTYVALATEDAIVGIFKLRDQLRPEAKAGLAALIALGIRPVMATGDGSAAAAAVARELGGIETRSGQTPAQKAQLIQELRLAGHTVAMAGDGINDAPALAAADVGLAMGSGTDAAIAAAGITLKDSSIVKVVEAVRLSRLTFRNIKQNLFWAFAYNVLLIPAAALGHLSPMLAAGAMAMSSLFVVGNALRLKAQV